MMLSEKQMLALQKYESGQNIFITGPGGSGKTELIRRIVEQSSATKKVQVCALTGCAALLLQCKARTLHSFAGIGLASGSDDDVVKRALSSGRKSQWSSIDVLVVDEVSMMSARLFTIIDRIARNARKRTNVPFGGLQLVFSGDFYQLPPVEPQATFCFESPNWDQTFDSVIELTTIFRQVDSTFQSILNQIRVGYLSEESRETLERQLSRPIGENFKPTMICPRRYEADRFNESELHALPGERRLFHLMKVRIAPPAPRTRPGADDRAQYGTYSDEQIENEFQRLIKTVLVEDQLALKVGAQVMVTANLDMETQIVNGSQGTVVDFVDGLPVVRFMSGHERRIEPHKWSSETIPSVAIRQLPLIYAWAITVHKAQGISLDVAQIDAGSSIFECGQIYVALSRVRSLSGLYLTNLDPAKIRANPKVQAYYASHCDKAPITQ